ncbi:MAG: beta strand repeat-containing protein [Solirubrobacteraceae bacterium]
MLAKLPARQLSILAVLVVAVSAVAGAWANFSAPGVATGTARVGTLNSPTNLTVPTNSSATVHVTWSASATGGGAVAPAGYYVERNDGSGWSAACGTTPGSTTSSTSCDDAGVAAGTYTYRVSAVFHSWTATSASINTVHVDTTPPLSTITFPTGGAFDNGSGYDAGCSTPGSGDVCGSASDPGAGASGVKKVQVSIQRSSDSEYWNGTTWVSGLTWNDAIGTASWSYTLDRADLTDGVSYTVQSQAIDNSSNRQTAPDSKTFTFDTTRPMVSSVTRQVAAPNPTHAATLPFTVTFSEPVAGVTSSNFVVVSSGTGGSAPTVAAASAAGGVPSATWTVLVSAAGTTGTNSGSIGLNLASNSGVSDAAGNALSTSSFTGAAYVYDTTAPAVSSISRAGSSPTNGGPLTWTVTFSEPVAGVTSSNFVVASGGTGGSAPTVVAASAVGGVPSATWTVSVATAGTTGTNSGSIGLNLASNSGVSDAAGNALSTSSFTGAAYVYDTTAPTMTLTAPANNSFSTNTTPTFSGACSTGDGSVTVTMKQAGTTVQTRSATCSAGSFSVAASPALAQATYTAQASQTDAAGNTGSSTTNTFTIDTTAPTAVDIQGIPNAPADSKPNTGDQIVLTFSEIVSSSSIVAGWDGTGSKTVVASFDTGGFNGGTALTLTPANLGPIDLGDTGTKYVGNHGARFTEAATITMATVNGKSAITVTLSAAGSATAAAGSHTLAWEASSSVTDLTGNAATATAASESGAADGDF